MVSELEAEGNMQGSKRQREAGKAACGRGRHARQHEAEGNTHMKGKSQDQKGRNTREIRDKSTKQESHRQSIDESRAE